MKQVKYSTKINPIVTTLLTIFILLSGCKKDLVLEPEILNSSSKTETVVNPGSTNSVSCYPVCERTVDLIAGQHTVVGTVHYKNNSNGIIDITYTVNAPWKLLNTSLYIGDCAQIPRNSSGNTIPGQYPYKQTLPSGGASSSVNHVNRSSVPTCGCIAAHASVKNTSTGATETAWGEGTKFTHSNWAMYYQYCLATCPAPTVGCSKGLGHFYLESNAYQLPANTAIGGRNYTPGDIYSIWRYTGSNNSDSKICLLQVYTAKLNSSTITELGSMAEDIAICENYLSSRSQKISPTYLPTGNSSARAAAERIKTWLDGNHCDPQ